MTSEGNPDPNNVPRATDLPDHSQRRSEISEDEQLPTPRIPHGCSGKVKKHWLDYVTFGAVLFAAVAAGFAAYYTKSQVKIAEETSYAQLRPWVGVDVRLAGDLELKSDSYRIKLLYKITNHGDTPAMEVYILPHIVLYTPGFDLDGERDKLCDFGSKNPPYFAEGIDTLFPKQTYDWVPHEQPLDKAAMEQSFEVLKKLFKSDSVYTITPFIIGCVTYRTTLDHTIHRTPFMFQVSRDDPDNFGNRRTIDARIGTVPLKSLVIKQEVYLKGIKPD
jgi:hypothetical protein